MIMMYMKIWSHYHMQVLTFIIIFLRIKLFFFIFRVLEKLFDENGYCMPFSRSFKQAKVKQPQRLVWEVSPDLEVSINEAVKFSQMVMY